MEVARDQDILIIEQIILYLDILVYFSFFQLAHSDFIFFFCTTLNNIMKLDQIDYKIIDMLQQDGRMTIRDMAQQLSLSTTPIFNRIKKLELEGVIEKYVAQINPKKVDKALYAFVHISIKEHSKEAVDNIVAQVVSFQEVLECHYVTGGADFVLKVLVKNMEAYNKFVTEKLFTVANIGKIDSLLSLSMPKHTSRIPLEYK